MKKPVLSIGMIFKNEIRCLERCLKSLQPLRDRLDCELVMADTGSDDGSREIAKKYADIFFDFPWINDFAAARNAVMDKCSGDWYLSIDADEWFDEDVDELVACFHNKDLEKYDACALTERNYYSYDLNNGYGAFMPWRMLRMSTGLRFYGAIHETWDLAGLRVLVLTKTVLHHDGYVGMNMGTSEGVAKRERNIKLLREKIEEDPKSLLARLQFIESGALETDFLDNLKKAVSLVEERATSWDTIGASVMRHAITIARARNLPEIEDWLHKAEEWFPGSYFIRIDSAFTAASYYLESKNYEGCIHWGEMGLQAYTDYREGKGEIACQLYGSLQSSTPLCEAALTVVLSRAYFEVERQQEALDLLASIDCTVLDAQWTQNLLESLQMIQHRSELDTAPILLSFWEGLNKPEPAQDWADRRRNAFVQLGGNAFTPEYRAQEEASEGFRRHVYTLYKPLLDCALGRAAAILDNRSLGEAETLLGAVDKWEEFPAAALIHAIQTGVKFPIAGQSLNLEELDGLASQLLRNQEGLHDCLEKSTEYLTENWQTAAWARALALAAVQSCPWKDEEEGMKLARTFTRIEKEFINQYYAPGLLQEENICLLPSMHRFGWYCAQAFAALDAGDAARYAHLLRKGLDACKSMKPMVEFLTEHTPELHTPEPDPELMDLAGKVHDLLNLYPQDDPAVIAIKQSPVYQRVAHLMETI